MMAEDITADVAAIKVPAMVILGERDKVERRPVLEAELLPRIPQATLHIIPDAGHLLPLEAPQALTERIVHFITHAL